MSNQATGRAKRRLVAIGISLAAHLMLLGFLYLIHLRSSALPLPKMEELVLVNLGDIPLASGQLEPEGKQVEEAREAMSTEPAAPTAKPEPRPISQPQPLPATPLPKPVQQTKLKADQTQRMEQTIAAREADAKRKADTEARAKAEAERQAQRIKAETEAKAKAAREQAAREAERRKQIGQSVAGAFGGKSGGGTSQGSASEGAGNQGDPKGSSDSYSLTGRTIVGNGGVPSRPKTNKAITGTVVVTIVVNASGRVTEATVNPQGTNIADPSIRSAAVAAAKATQFNAVPNASEQRGSIKYRFVQ